MKGKVFLVKEERHLIVHTIASLYSKSLLLELLKSTTKLEQSGFVHALFKAEQLHVPL